MSRPGGVRCQKRERVTGGYHPRRGAAQGAIFANLLTTAHKLGQAAYERLCTIAGLAT